MKTIKACKAEPFLTNDEPTQDTTINITEKLPDYKKFKSLKETENFYGQEAELIESALFHSLPQGTYDRLAIKIMSRKVSLYRGRTE